MAALILEMDSSFPKTSINSVAPPGVICFPDSCGTDRPHHITILVSFFFYILTKHLHTVHRWSNLPAPLNVEGCPLILLRKIPREVFIFLCAYIADIIFRYFLKEIHHAPAISGKISIRVFTISAILLKIIILRNDFFNIRLCCSHKMASKSICLNVLAIHPFQFADSQRLPGIC